MKRWMLVTALLLAATGCGGKKNSPQPGPSGWKAAIGDEGMLVETFGDGAWKTRKISDTNLYAVSCVNNRVGWAVGANGAILHTTDGGQSWKPQTSGASGTLRAVAFAIRHDSTDFVGVAAGDDGALLVSRDGTSWAPEVIDFSGSLRGVAISEGGEIMFAAGDHGRLFRSKDSGSTWKAVRTDATGNFYDVAMDAEGEVVLVVDDTGAIWSSIDSGKNFLFEYNAPRGLESVSLSRTHAWGLASGLDGLALVRTARGTWSRVDVGTTETLHAALIGPSEEEFYLAGDRGILIESDDHGRTWEREDTETEVALRALEDLEAR
jgi:photosystem II stability/assembly factor-like uncharacterized protein